MKKNKYIVQIILLSLYCSAYAQADIAKSFDIKKIDRERILTAAEKFLTEEPVTITSTSSPRSAGGKHDFFSESDYWWPDPQNPEGPYIRKDGMTNPDNFVGHRKAMIRFSIQVPTLTAAYIITKDKKYSKHAVEHILAWFVNEETKMNPSLQYAQAVKGITTGRGVGIIDTIHLIEIVRSIMILEKAGAFSKEEMNAIKNWFVEYLKWLTTSKNGKEEMEAKNNHGTCWVMQVSQYAKLVNDEQIIDMCKNRFKEIILPTQMGQDGSFPLEIARTKPYSYSLFNLDAMAAICQILSDNKENLFNFTLPDGRNLKKGIEFMYPFIADKSLWKYPKDVMYYDVFPNRQPALLFGALAYNEGKYLNLWKTLNPDPDNEEVIRNFPIRQPILWLD